MLSRRRFLQQTFVFSALAGLPFARRALAAPVDPGAAHLLMLGDWGAAGKLDIQTSVARAMQTYVAREKIKPQALFFLGDNFYGKFPGHVKSPRWKTQFEDMYPRSVFDVPCYAILGNHDYHVEPADKLDAQLAYAAATPGTRWTMPAKWFRFEFPKENPLITFLALDSNYQAPSETRGGLSADERKAQAAWLSAELAKPRTTPFLALAGHHPLYSNGKHGDSTTLQKLWEPLLRKHRAHFYFCGHDHDLQHLEFAGHPTSFVISGGGGASLYDLNKKQAARGPYAEKIAGFTHLEITPQRVVVRHVSSEAQVVHAFAKAGTGEVSVI